jgi:hypothetical protein
LTGLVKKLILYLYNVIQQLVILLLFSAATLYLVRMVYKAFKSKTVCSTGCGKCGAVDFTKIEQQLKEKGV